MGALRQVFRSSFTYMWRWTTACCSIFGAAIYFVALLTGTPIPLASTACGALVIGALFAVAIIAYPVYVSTDGIRCYNFYGIYRTIPWHTVSQIRYMTVFGLPYLAVSSALGGSEITVPLFFSNMRRFLEVVREYAGEDHSLTKALKIWLDE